MGEMADDEYFRMFDTVEDVNRNVKCRRCGEDDLHFELHTGNAWILCDEDGDRHVCTPDAKGFTAL